MNIALISCSSKKKNYECKAEEMYSESTLFRYSLKYAKQKFDKIFILSAKYKLLDLNKIIIPYNITLNKMSKNEKDDWYKEVSKQITNQTSIDDIIYILAGKNYYSHLSIPNQIIIITNLPIGKRIKWLKDKTCM